MKSTFTTKFLSQVGFLGLLDLRKGVVPQILKLMVFIFSSFFSKFKKIIVLLGGGEEVVSALSMVAINCESSFYSEGRAIPQVWFEVRNQNNSPSNIFSHEINIYNFSSRLAMQERVR